MQQLLPIGTPVRIKNHEAASTGTIKGYCGTPANVLTAPMRPGQFSRPAVYVVEYVEELASVRHTASAAFRLDEVEAL